jgi:hypothetical protein
MPIPTAVFATPDVSKTMPFLLSLTGEVSYSILLDGKRLLYSTALITW